MLPRSFLKRVAIRTANVRRSDGIDALVVVGDNRDARPEARLGRDRRDVAGRLTRWQRELHQLAALRHHQAMTAWAGLS